MTSIATLRKEVRALKVRVLANHDIGEVQVFDLLGHDLTVYDSLDEEAKDAWLEANTGIKPVSHQGNKVVRIEIRAAKDRAPDDEGDLTVTSHGREQAETA